MRIAGPIFHIFDAPTHFSTHIFQKYASRCCGKHIFAKRILALPIKHITLLPPERPHLAREEPLLPIWLALVALLVVRIAIFPPLGPFKKRLWLESRARFASRARSAATTAYIIPANLWISYATYCFLCIFTAAYTLVFTKLHIFCKKRSPPSVGSTSLKAAEMRNHRKSACSGLQLLESAPFLHRLLHPGLLQKQ